MDETKRIQIEALVVESLVGVVEDTEFDRRAEEIGATDEELVEVFTKLPKRKQRWNDYA